MLKLIRKFVWQNRLLVLILIFAVGLRFTHLSFLPPSLNWDEVSHGYNAYSILKTGKDEWRQAWPIIFRAYGDYKLPVYVYLAVIAEAIFGLNAFAVRFPSVLAGVASVIFTYLLVRELFKNHTPYTKHNTPALLAALLVTIEPWSLFLSRGAFEANLALAFITGGLYFFLRGLHTPSYLLHSTIFFGLSVWTYNSARIFTPVFILFLAYWYKDDIKKIYRRSPATIYWTLITAAALLLPMFYQLLNPQGLARYGRVEILDEGAVAQINEARNSSTLSSWLSALVHNKATYFTSKFITNWASHFSGDFLFFKGGTHFQFSIPGHGILFIVNLPFLIFGLFYLLKKKSRETMLILGWFFLGPIASSLTREAPHVLRSITMLPSPMIISAAGFYSSLKWVKARNKAMAKVFLFIYLVLLFVSFGNYAQAAVSEYREKYSWSWQYGYKQVVDYVRENYDGYDKILVTKKYGEPHEFFLFFWPWSPKAYQEDENLIRFYQSDWYWVDRFDKFYFVNDWDIVPPVLSDDVPEDYGYYFYLESGERVNCLTEKCLLVTSPSNAPGGWSKLETINFLDEKPAFEIFEN